MTGIRVSINKIQFSSIHYIELQFLYKIFMPILSFLIIPL